MPAQSKPQVYDSQGRQLSLGDELARGGEGAVYDLRGRADLVGKIYLKHISQDKADKLALMVSVRTDRLLRLAAWPVDTLHDRPGGATVGFLMPRVAAHKDIHFLYGVKSRLNTYPEARWPFLIQAAANVARAFKIIHDHGHVIGDVNPGGIGVSKTATVTLFDCDSFQITAQGRQYLCEVGVDTHTPPELQGRPFRGVIRTPDHDAFGLAVTIFLLLFMGRHPFAGTFLGSRETPALQKLIGEYRFAYGPGAAPRQMKQPPGTLDLDDVSPPVATLFERAFARGVVRPKPDEWIPALGALASNLGQCSRNSGHHYLRSLATCPWCRIEAQSAIILFTPVFVAGVMTPGPHGGTFHITAIWAQIEAVPAPGPLPPYPDKASFHLARSPEATRVRRSLLLRSALAGAVLLTASVGIVMLPIVATASAWLVVIAGIAAVVVSRSGNSEARQRVAKSKQDADRRWREVEQRWKAQADDQRFYAKRRELEARKQEYEGLPAARQRKLQELEKNIRQRQLQKHLDKYRIENAGITGIGPGRQATLRSYGIETAADVTSHAILAVPGFGATYTSRLLTWRHTVEQRFTYNPARGVDPADRDAVEKEFAGARAKIEQELQSGSTQLRQIGHQIITARETMRAPVEAAIKEAAQAEIDAGGTASAALLLSPVLATMAAALLAIQPVKTRLYGGGYGFNFDTRPPAASSTPSVAPTSVPTPASSPIPTAEQIKAESQLRYAEGVEYTKKRRYQDAVLAYQQAVTLNPDYADAYHELGFALLKLAKYQDSVAASQKAIKLRPDDAEAFHNLALAYQSMRRWKDAAEALKQSLKLKPNTPTLYYELGVIAKNTDDSEAAIEAFREAVRLKPDYALAHYELGLAYVMTEEPQLASEQYDILSTLNPKLAEKLLDKLTVPPKGDENSNIQP